jgi:hypothetical protein
MTSVYDDVDITKKANDEMRKIKLEEEKKNRLFKIQNRFDYSENIFNELNMVNLQSIYERSIFELHELRLLFKIPAPGSKQNDNHRDKMLMFKTIND